MNDKPDHEERVTTIRQLPDGRLEMTDSDGKRRIMTDADSQTDWAFLDSLTEEQIEAMVRADPDTWLPEDAERYAAEADAARKSTAAE